MPACVCGRAFTTPAGLEAHRAVASRESFTCSTCSRIFCLAGPFRRHAHQPCQTCGADAGSHRYCPKCRSGFASRKKLELARHAQDQDQDAGMATLGELPVFGCSACARMFRSAAAVEQHIRDSKETRAHRTAEMLSIRQKGVDYLKQQHQQPQEKLDGAVEDLQQEKKTKKRKKVKKVKKVKKLFRCEDCPKSFRKDEDLQRHRESVAHIPLSDLPCIAGRYRAATRVATPSSGATCPARFACPSAMLQHLESGRCTSGINRETLNLIIQTNDTEHVITKPTPLPFAGDVSVTAAFGALRIRSGPSTPGGSDSTDYGGAILTPGSEVSDAQPLYHTDNTRELPLVPSMRCPLCPRKLRTFPTLRALGQHMQSAAHSATARIFHCPVALLAEELSRSGTGDAKQLARQLKREGRKKGFSMASSLAQHLESGACAGGRAALRVALRCVEQRLEQGALSLDESCDGGFFFPTSIHDAISV